MRSKGHNLPHQKRCVASFRVAGMALRAIPTCFTTCQKSFCVTGAILLHRFQKKTSMSRGRRSTLDVSTFIFRGRQSPLGLSCCVFLQLALSGLRQVVVQIAWQARGFRKTRRKRSISYLQSDNCCFPHWHGCARCHVVFVFRAIPRGGHSTSVRGDVATCHSGPGPSHSNNLPHFPPLALNMSHYTPHSTLLTSHSTLYTGIPHMQSTLYNLHFTLRTPHFTLYTVHSTLYT